MVTANHEKCLFIILRISGGIYRKRTTDITLSWIHLSRHFDDDSMLSLTEHTRECVTLLGLQGLVYKCHYLNKRMLTRKKKFTLSCKLIEKTVKLMKSFLSLNHVY